MSVGSLNIVQRIKKLKIEALKSGKIKVDKVRSEIYRSPVSEDENGRDLLCIDQWIKFQNCDNIQWKDFENQEYLLRKQLETKKMVVKTKFVHPNPSIWIKLITLISNIFYKDNVLVDIRPDGNPFSIEFLKFVKRVLFKFPVKPQSSYDSNMTEREVLLCDINYVVTFVKKYIQPCFRQQRTRTPVPVDDDSDNDTVSDTVSRAELAHLWKTDRKTAVRIINNDGKRPEHTTCPVDINTIEAHYTEKTKRQLHSPIPPPPWNSDININNPDNQLCVDAITDDEIYDVIGKLPSRKSPGADGVTYETIKTRKNVIVPILTIIFNVCFNNCRVPSDWTHGIITLLPKTDDPISLDDFRPISLLLSFYKIFMKVIQERVMPWVVGESRLSMKQKGSMPRPGLYEHVFCLTTSVSDFVHKSGQLYVGFVDIKDAFGSLDHEIMLRELESIGLPEKYLQLTKAIYDSSTFQVKTNGGITGPIERHKGIIQGCPYSVLAFEIAIDKWLRWLDVPARVSPSPAQGYVDDVCYAETSVVEFKEMTRKTEVFLDNTGMEAKHRKCAILQGKRSGNNWKELPPCEIVLQNDVMPVINRDQSYPYLGHDFYIDNKCNTQTSDLISSFKDNLKMLHKSLLPISAKLEAINGVYLHKISFYFPTLMFTVKELTEIEDLIVFYVRNWLKLNTSSTRSYFFTPRSQGGLGMINPTVLFNGKYMAFKLCVLNSDDPHVKSTARESLLLHMTRRKVKICNDEENSFAGYMIENGKLAKESKIYFPKSQWVFLFELCKREHIILRYDADTEAYSYIFSMEDDVSVSITHSKAFYIVFKNMKISKFIHDWMDKSSQGKIRKTTDGKVDQKISTAFLNNHKLSDDIISFACRGRLQLLQCNTLMHLYYKTHKFCDLCNHPYENISHVLNGCRKLKDIYSKRHNRLVDLIHEKIAHTEHLTVIKDCSLSPCEFSNSNQESFVTTHRRPDITVINIDTKKVQLIEVAVPFDTHIEETYQAKFDKYYPLSIEINQLGFSTEIVVLVVGSLGSVHTKFISGLAKLDINKREAKCLSKFCSISTIIGSSKVWKTRCRLTLNTQ